MDTKQKDQQASDLHTSGMTWAAVAEQMYYANGSVARRAAMRYETKHTSTPVDLPITIKVTPRLTIANPIPVVEFKPVDTKNFTVEQATRYVEQIIIEHGHPNWVAHVPIRVRNMVPQETLVALMALGVTEDRSTRQGRNDILSWCDDNVFAIVTVAQIAEIGKVTRTEARRLIANRMDIFRKSDGRTYEIRDPQQDRINDRRSA